MKFRGWFKGPDELMRNIIIKLNGLSSEQRILEDYERCYSCQLFDDRNFSWDMTHSKMTGEYIPQEYRKPLYHDPVAKEIVDTIASFIFGTDKFPSIVFKAFQDLYPNHDLIQRAIDNGELKEEKVKNLNEAQLKKLKIKLSNQQIQKFSSGILNAAFLNQYMLDAARKALTIGRSIVVPKLIDGVFYFEVINYKFVKNMEMHERIPDKIVSFSEFYAFEAPDPKKPTETSVFWSRRDFTEKEEITYFPIKESEYKGLPETWKWTKDKNKSYEHNLGYCPAILMSSPNNRSILHGQIDNIRQLVYLTNNIYVGMRQNMDPQWVGLFGEESVLNDANFSAKMKGGIWAFTGVKDVKPLTSNFNGYDSARQLRKELKSDIMKACRVEDIPVSNQQSRAALVTRMSPTLDAIGEYQVCFGDRGLMKICEMVMNMAIQVTQRGEEILIRNDTIVPESDKFICSLGWGQKTPITEDDIMKAITNSLTAYKGGLVDLEHAVNRIAPFFNVVDVEDMLRKIREKMDDVVGGEDARQMYGRLVHKVNKGNKELEAKGERKDKEDEDGLDVEETNE